MSTEDGKDDPIDVELVRQLADLLTESGLTEIEVERGDIRIKVSRTLTVAEVEQIPALQAPAGPQGLIAAPQPSGQPAPVAAAARGEVVKSPMVGTVYHQAQPGSPPFVKAGDIVSAGQTLMIIEAMKTMNPVPSPRDGKVLEVLVDDGQPVEFGEPLVVLE